MKPDDPFVNSVHCLIVSMIELHGLEELAKKPWYGQDFLRVKHELEEMGRSCDVENRKEP